MSNIEISKINIDETQLLIKDAQNRQDLTSLSTEVQSISTNLASLSTKVQSISTNLASLSTSISTDLTSLSTEVQSISTNLNSLSASISTNYLPLSGGTLTGELTTSSHLTIKDNTLDTNSLEEMWPRHFSIKDKDDTTRGYFEIYQQPDGTQGFQIEAQRLINDKPIYNGIRLAITSTGGRLIRVTPGAESAWRNALGASDGVWPISLGGTGATSVASSTGAVHTLFPTNLGTTIEFLAGLTSNYTKTGYTKLPLAAALGGTGGIDSGWQTYTSTAVFSGTIYYRNLGKITIVSSSSLKLADDVTITNTNGKSLGTVLPSGYRPNGHNVVAKAMSTYDVPATVTITTSGVMTVYKKRSVSEMSSTQNFYIEACFFNAA